LAIVGQQPRSRRKRNGCKSGGFGLLKGIRVVDFAQFEPGTSCTETLAWMGAEVVKIENPKSGDPRRSLQPGRPDNGPYYFFMFNANKKSVTINLKTTRGLEIVRELLKKADATVENMAPGAIERLGLGYDAVRELNPGIIFAKSKALAKAARTKMVSLST
jgi:formyl-CoA transferase